MTHERLIEVLTGLALAARKQGMAPYDHGAAMDAAGVHERSEKLGLAIKFWAPALPPPYRTIENFCSQGDAAGDDMAAVFELAAENAKRDGGANADH